jgi:hypothetical protein
VNEYHEHKNQAQSKDHFKDNFIESNTCNSLNLSKAFFSFTSKALPGKEITLLQSRQMLDQLKFV